MDRSYHNKQKTCVFKHAGSMQLHQHSQKPHRGKQSNQGKLYVPHKISLLPPNKNQTKVLENS